MTEAPDGASMADVSKYLVYDSMFKQLFKQLDESHDEGNSAGDQTVYGIIASHIAQSMVPGFGQ